MKIKKVLSLTLALILCTSSFSFAFAEGQVTDGYTPIYTAKDLDSIREDLSGKFVLMNDIDLSEYSTWEPIGDSQAPFCGEFNGNSFTVRNVNISKNDDKSLAAGLFGTVANSMIKDVTVIGQINVSNDNGIRAGLICGEAYDTVITNCKTYGKVETATKSGAWVGGVVGFLSISDKEKESKIALCQNNADITAEGVCGYQSFSINFFVGGIAGICDGTVSECSNYGNITAVGKNGGYDYFYTLAGGICGNSGGETTDCYNVGDVYSVGTKYTFAGGISGFWYQFYDISNCYNVGEIKAEVKETTDEYNLSAAGGIIGVVESMVSPDSEDPLEDYTAHISNCYYLDNIERAFGEAAPQEQKNIRSLALEDFSNISSFEGFDFENIWKMSETKNRPILRNETEVVAIAVEIKTGRTFEIKDIDEFDWISSNEKVAVVVGNNIKGRSAGTADIVIIEKGGRVIEYNVTVRFSLFWWLVDFLFGWIK